MRKIGATFLTEKSIDKDKVLLTLKKSINLTQEENLILKEIISSFEENNYSLLTAQEIQFLNNHSSDQWSKYIIFRYKFKNYPKKHIDSDIPTHIIVEPISACNLRCVFCYQVDEDFSNNQNYMGSMNLELFEKIVDQVHSIGIQALTITGRGEPTLNPKIGAMLEYCKGKFFDLKMNTNATRLDEKLIHQILKSGVTDLVFSVDAYEKKE